MEKGWKSKHINHAVRTIEKAKANRHPKIKILDSSVYWISLFVAIIGNLIISISLIPVLLVLSKLPLYLILTTIGISFGLLFEILIRTIEHLQTKHHLFLGTIIPIIAIINIIVIVIFSNNFEKTIDIQNPHNPFLIGIVYAAAFILPYLTYQFLSRTGRI
jgi:hypothetical protein